MTEKQLIEELEWRIKKLEDRMQSAESKNNKLTEQIDSLNMRVTNLIRNGGHI